VIDSTGAPKSTYWYLKRAFAPIALFSADEGLNGLRLHALNDTSEAVDAELTVTCYRDGVAVGREARVTLKIPARGARTVSASELFGAFVDITDAYRFGSLAQDCLASTLRDRRTGRVLASDCYCPGRLPSTAIDVGLRAHAEPTGGGYMLRLDCQRFAYAVAIDIDGYHADDNYFHLEPGEARRVILTAAGGSTGLQGRVSALNGHHAVPIVAIVEPLHAG
jgi:beta-mannosidase